MILANPVRGEIHPLTWSRPSGNDDFKITQRFGCTGFSWEPPLGNCNHFHRGLDLGNARCGYDVLATAAGKVRYAGKDPYDGAIVVMIDHGDGWWSLYWHLARETTSVGASVEKGDKIGDVGASGNATACHLHFAVKRNMPDGSTTAQAAGDRVGDWVDPWPRLMQNVTVHPRGPGVNIRGEAGSGSTLGPLFAATTNVGSIVRKSDGKTLGPTTEERKWGGRVSGAKYVVDGTAGDTWERIRLDGDWRFIASPLAVRSI